MSASLYDLFTMDDASIKMTTFFFPAIAELVYHGLILGLKSLHL